MVRELTIRKIPIAHESITLFLRLEQNFPSYAVAAHLSTFGLDINIEL